MGILVRNIHQVEMHTEGHNCLSVFQLSYKMKEVGKGKFTGLVRIKIQQCEVVKHLIQGHQIHNSNSLSIVDFINLDQMANNLRIIFLYNFLK